MTPPASGRETPLSRDEVIEAALDLTRRVGLRGLTMRGLAKALGVSPMATYHYVANKGELVELVSQAVSSTWPHLEPGEDPWEEVLRRHLLLIWESLRQYPGLGSHLIEQPSMGFTPQIVDGALAFFAAAGFPTNDAMLAWSLTETYLHGRLSVDALLHGQSDARLDTLRARDFVEFGVDTLVSGLQIRLSLSPDSIGSDAPV
jgi:TetR/AcrR family tetracycline transcriptional repressor